MCVCVCVCMCVCTYAYINISLYVIRKWYRVCLEATLQQIHTGSGSGIESETLWKVRFGSGIGSEKNHSGSTTLPEGFGSGSGSYFGKVLVPVPAPVPIRTYLARFFNNKKCVQTLAFSILEAVLFPRKLAFFYFCITFYVGSELEPECISVSCSAQAKSCGLGSGFGSTTLPNIAQGREYFCLWFIEDQAFWRSYDLASRPPPASLCHKQGRLSFSVFLCVAGRAYGQGGRGSEPNHTTARKPGPL
jgi:hypothetical protein